MDSTINTQWIAALLGDMLKDGRKGKLIEVRNDNGKLIVSAYLDQVSYADFERYQKNMNLQKFFGKFELNYANGSCTVRTIVSLTEGDVKTNANILKL